MSAVQAGPSCLRGQITSFTVPPKQISVKNVYPCHVNFIFFLTEHTTGVYIKHCYTLVDAEKTFIIFGVESDHSSYVKMYILWTLAIFLVQWDSVHWILSGHLRRSSFCVVFCISCHPWELDQHAEYELVFLLLSVVPHPYPHFPRVGGGDR